MGMTGAGKSSFVNTLTGSDVSVGHGIESRKHPILAQASYFG